MLLASVELFPFPPEQCFSAGLWDRFLFLPTPCDKESHQFHPSLSTKILFDIGMVALSR